MILLIRHCSPNINYANCNFLEAQTRINEYNTTKDICLSEIATLKTQISNLLGDYEFTLLSSPLSRALITAQAVFPDNAKQIIVNDYFIEFDLAILPLHGLQVKFRTWIFISRIMWMLGILKTDKTFAQERLRAIKASQSLLEQAKDKPVALVAHGLLNHFIKKNLKKSGYKQVCEIRAGCFAITKLIHSPAGVSHRPLLCDR